MTVKEVVKLLREYDRLNEKIFSFNQQVRRCKKEKEEAQKAYPQASVDRVRVAQTNKITDPTYQAVEMITTIYDKEIERLTRDITLCADKKDLVDGLLDMLDVEERDAIKLYYFQGLRPIHIASRLHMSESSYYRVKRRAIKKMSDFGTDLES